MVIHKYSGVVRVSLRKSPRLAGLIVTGALATAVLTLVTPLAAGARALALTAIAVLALDAWRVLVRRQGRRAAHGLRVDARGAIEVRDGLGVVRSGRLAAGSLVAPWLIALRWRPAGARFDRAILIVPGMAPREQLRALRVVLRWAEYNPRPWTVP